MRHWWWACWNMFHDLSREFRQTFPWREWRMMTVRLHDEHWWKRGWSQRLCKHTIYSQALKPSHNVKACVLSNHVEFRCIQAQVEGISTLAPFTAQRATSVDNGISDGLVGRLSMTFQESFNKDFVDGNVKWLQWDCIWTLMKMWIISNIMLERHASFSLETIPHHEGMCLI